MKEIPIDDQIRIYHVDTDWGTPLRTDVTLNDVLKALRFSKLTGIKENDRYALAMGTISMLSGLTGAATVIESAVFNSPEPLWLAATAFGLAAFTGYIAVGSAHVADQQYRKEESLASTSLS